ncbi:carotenoid biosynthesis protein [Terrimonas sp.]|uniref:carotenoid biosynthesis protein n=1 Tax=Terrimonas sp. TaxID=1914338 RepID=UPI000D510E93|nr:carotenoid biosynthesis protein [Terrimonas sp.]PVD52075.1 carotenoid biosynthesis protein [Terrimonas sp.]
MLIRKKYNIAFIISLVIHISGLAGMLWGNRQLFATYTPANLLIMFLLLLWTQEKINKPFIFFMLACLFSGYFVEYIGVHTGLLFGNYTYGKVLGSQLSNIPLIIGINWFIVMYCCGTVIQLVTEALKKRLPDEQLQAYKKWSIASVIIDGALLAVFFDWVMEPVAVKLGFWTWAGDGSIPMLNYISWFGVSVILLSLFSLLPFHKKNIFALYLLMIQLMFFLVLRTLLI